MPKLLPTTAFLYFFIFTCIYFYLEDNCFTILCWLLPYISMNQPQVYICSLPTCTPSYPPRLSQSPCLSSLHHTADFHRLSNFTFGIVYVSKLLPQFIPPSPSPTKIKTLNHNSHGHAYTLHPNTNGFQPGASLPPREHLALPADLTGGMLLASGEQKPEMLLNILNAQDILTTKRNLAPNVSSG